LTFLFFYEFTIEKKILEKFSNSAALASSAAASSLVFYYKCCTVLTCLTKYAVQWVQIKVCTEPVKKVQNVHIGVA